MIGKFLGYSRRFPYLFVVLKSLKISQTKIHPGPPLKKSEYVDAFLNKWQNHDQLICPPFVKNQRWWVEIERQYESAQELLENKIDDVTLGKHLDQLKNQAIILAGKQLARPSYAAFLTEYLSDVPPWKR